MADEILVVIIGYLCESPSVSGNNEAVEDGKHQENDECQPSFFFSNLEYIENFSHIGFAMINLLFLFLFEKEPHQEEVDWDADAERRNHCPLFGESQPYEDIQAEGLHRIVDDVRQGESCSPLGIRFHLEGIACAGDEVEDETHQVGDGIGGSCQGMVADLRNEMS